MEISHERPDMSRITGVRIQQLIAIWPMVIDYAKVKHQPEVFIIELLVDKQ